MRELTMGEFMGGADGALSWARQGAIRQPERWTVDQGEEVEVVPVGAAATRDEEFAAFAAEAMPALGRTAWLLCGDHLLAEELVQQALVRTYVAWPAARRGEPLAYARRVLANARIDHWRRRRREVLTGPDFLPDRAVVDRSEAFADRDEVAWALAQLPVKRRRIVVLRYALGLSEREVADDLGISLGAVKSASSRGLAQLHELLVDASTRSSSRAGTTAPPTAATRGKEHG